MLDKITTGKIQRAQKVLLYGIEKVGKSSLAAKFPAPLFLDVEQGTHQLDLNRLDIKSADELDKAITWVARDQHNYKTLVVDSVDWAEKLLADRVLVENNWKSIETPNYGKGFVVLREAFKLFLESLGPVICKEINVVLIGHAHIKKYNPPEASEGYDRWELKLDKENTPRAKEWADAILFAKFETKIIESGGKTKGIGGKERVIYTTSSAAYDAGNRHGFPEKIKMDIEALAPLFAANQGGGDPTSFPDTTQQEVSSTNSTESPADKTLQGVIDKTWTSEFKGANYYFALINGRQVQTTNAELGEALLEATGEIIATVKPSGKPNKYYLEAFEYPEAAKTVEMEVVK
jgi:hypothetical protein